MNRALLSVILGLAAAALIVEAPACKPGQVQAVTVDVTPAGACIAQQLLVNGVTDPLAIVAACGPATIDAVIAVLETLLAAQPDASSPVAARLAEAHAKALAAKAAKAGAK